MARNNPQNKSHTLLILGIAAIFLLLLMVPIGSILMQFLTFFRGRSLRQDMVEVNHPGHAMRVPARPQPAFTAPEKHYSHASTVKTPHVKTHVKPTKSTQSMSKGSTRASSKIPKACSDQFEIKRLNGAAHDGNLHPNALVLVQNKHLANERAVQACVQSLAEPGAKVLMEEPPAGKEVACDKSVQGYAVFKAKGMTCIGYDREDPEVLEPHAISTNYAFHRIFSDVLPRLVLPGESGRTLAFRLRTFLDESPVLKINQPGLLPGRIIVLQREREYITRLADRVQVLSFEAVKPFLDEEFASLDREFKRLGPLRNQLVNPSLVEQIERHQPSADNPHRLFVIGGRQHVDPQYNPGLLDVAERFDEAVLLTMRRK